jgi:hypothetical protein
MFSCLLSLCLSTVAQSSPEAAWLGSVPSDVPVVARVRALEDVRGDLMAMLKAMSPNVANAAQGGLDQGLQAVEGIVGEPAVKNPLFVLLRLPDPEQPAPPAWGIIIKASDYPGLLKALSQDGVGKPKALDGYDSFTGKTGETWFAVKGSGWVAFGPDEAPSRPSRRPAPASARRSRPRPGRSSWPATSASI